MRRRTALVGVLTLFLMLCLPLPSAASADATWHPDADDSASRLDIRRAGVLRRERHRVTIKIRTFERINLRRNGELWALLDARGGSRWDYGFHIHFDSGSDGIYCDWRNRQGQVNPLITWSVQGRTAFCRFNARQIGIDKPVRWRVFSTGLNPSKSPKPTPTRSSTAHPTAVDGSPAWNSPGGREPGPRGDLTRSDVAGQGGPATRHAPKEARHAHPFPTLTPGRVCPPGTTAPE